MSGNYRLQQNLRNAFGDMQSGIQYRNIKRAWLGKTATSAPGDGASTGHVWVRIGSENALPQEVFNPAVQSWAANMLVRVGEDKETGRKVIIGTHPDMAVINPTYAATLNTPDQTPEALYSQEVYMERLTNLRLYPGEGLTLGVRSGYYFKGNTLVYFEGGTVDLTSAVPGTVNEKAMVLVGIDYATNTITTDLQTAVSMYTQPREGKLFYGSDIAGYVNTYNTSATDTYWLGAVPLVYGQTSLKSITQYTSIGLIAGQVAAYLLANGFELGDGADIATGTTTGTKFGTSTSQKLGFFGVTPVVQQAALTSAFTPAGISTITHTTPAATDTAISAPVDSSGGAAFGFANANEFNTIMSIVADLQERVASLETRNAELEARDQAYGLGA